MLDVLVVHALRSHWAAVFMHDRIFGERGPTVCCNLYTYVILLITTTKVLQWPRSCDIRYKVLHLVLCTPGHQRCAAEACDL